MTQFLVSKYAKLQLADGLHLSWCTSMTPHDVTKHFLNMASIITEKMKLTVQQFKCQLYVQKIDRRALIYELKSLESFALLLWCTS